MDYFTHEVNYFFFYAFVTRNNVILMALGDSCLVAPAQSKVSQKLLLQLKSRFVFGDSGGFECQMPGGMQEDVRDPEEYDKVRHAVRKFLTVENCFGGGGTAPFARSLLDRIPLTLL